MADAALPFLAIPDLTAALPTVVFFALAGLSIAAAVLAATARKIVHAAFGLMATFFGVGGLYAMLGADFVALAQIVVYVGGIMVLLVFGILLTSRVRGTLGLEKEPRSGFAVFAGALLFLGLLLALNGTDFHAVKDPGPAEPTTAAIGRALLDPEQYLVPFELASVLLLAALVGAAYLARRRREG
jgi:NADH-quinone oxidoreductase subunit J